MYYEEKLIQSAGNMKQTWKKLNEILYGVKGNNVRKSEPKIILSEGKTITDPQIICEKLNNHFVSIGPEIGENISVNNNLNNSGNILTYMNSQASDSMFVTPVCEEEVKNM